MMNQEKRLMQKDGKRISKIFEKALIRIES